PAVSDRLAPAQSAPRPAVRQHLRPDAENFGGGGLFLTSEHDARRTNIREWMSLPPDKRQNQEQAATFAIKALEKHKFRCSGNPHYRIMAWLSPRIGKT